MGRGVLVDVVGHDTVVEVICGCLGRNQHNTRNGALTVLEGQRRH